VPQYHQSRDRKTGVDRLVKSGVWIAADGAMFWRANSGGRPDANGRIVMGNPSGTADILGCVAGRLVGLEVKREGEKQNPNQLRWEQWVRAAGGVYAVVRCPSDAKRVVEEVRNGSQ
jgi:hypothetical protein